MASAGGHLEAVRYLASLGVRINPRDRWGATPLNDAKTDAMRRLLHSYGAVMGVE